MKLLRWRESLLLSAILSLSSCASFKTSDWAASITLPASLDCYSVNVMSGKETRYPAESEECEYLKLHSVWIDSRSYKMLKKDIQSNCRTAQCSQITGQFDSLFLTIDEAVKKIPLP